jgi:hypothetical protein
MKTNPNSTAPDDNITKAPSELELSSTIRVESMRPALKKSQMQEKTMYVPDEIFAAPEFFFALDSRALCRLDQLAY